MFNDTDRVAACGRGARSIRPGSAAFPDARARLRAIDQILSLVKYMEFDERLGKAAPADVTRRRRIAERPDDELEPQVRELHQLGIDRRAHDHAPDSVPHRSAVTVRREIGASREILQGITGASISLFAYPNGRPYEDYDGTHVEIVRSCGFAAAVSTAWGAATRRSDRYQLPRLMPWDKTALRFAARLLRARRELSATAVPVPAN
jgi:peptidoglycan/xylan/chitin deacetylase (PgdA/CDA1 family)